MLRLTYRQGFLSAVLMLVLMSAMAQAQQYDDYSGYPGHGGYGRGWDFGPLETGVLPNGAEIPDVTLDEIDATAERRPARAQALPPPADVYGNQVTAPATSKKRRTTHY